MPVDVEARVISNTRLSSDYNVIALEAPEIARGTAPGQFVMVKPGRGTDPLLRRPFSVFEVLELDGAVTGLSLLSKRIGVTTRLLFNAVEGDVVSCLGPLGRPYTLVDPPAEAWMVAGGVGLAPFATLANALASRGVKTTLFYGGPVCRFEELLPTDINTVRKIADIHQLLGSESCGNFRVEKIVDSSTIHNRCFAALVSGFDTVEPLFHGPVREVRALIMKENGFVRRVRS